jgi:hypothetical protein
MHCALYAAQIRALTHNGTLVNPGQALHFYWDQTLFRRKSRQAAVTYSLSEWTRKLSAKSSRVLFRAKISQGNIPALAGESVLKASQRSLDCFPNLRSASQFGLRPGANSKLTQRWTASDSNEVFFRPAHPSNEEFLSRF